MAGASPSGFASLRQSMAWFHTCFGVVTGFLLFAVFWMGTLSVLDKEFDRWMHPQSRGLESFSIQSSTEGSCCRVTAEKLETLLQKAIELAPNSISIRVRMPTERTPMAQLRVQGADKQSKSYWINPNNGRALANDHTLGGSGFFFPFHYKFNIARMNVGHYLVGFAGIVMLALLISGVVLHRKLLAEFFMFRPQKNKSRSLLDLHNLSSVVALPFHVVITLTGLLIFFSVYFSWATLRTFEGDTASSQKALNGFVNLPPSGIKVSKDQLEIALKQIPQLIQARQTIWSKALGQPAQADSIQIRNLFDQNATLEIRRVFPEQGIQMSTHTDTLLLYSGELIHAHQPGAVKGFTHWINGLHFIQFSHSGLRALYVVGGLLGCLMIHTGFLFWLETRRKEYRQKNQSLFAWVQALTVTSTLGLMIASAAFLVANQLIPDETPNRATVEVAVFYWTWAVCLVASLAQAYLQRCTGDLRHAGVVNNSPSHTSVTYAILNPLWLTHPWLFHNRVFGLLCALAWGLNQINTGGMVTAIQHMETNSLHIDLLLLFGIASAAYANLKISDTLKREEIPCK